MAVCYQFLKQINDYIDNDIEPSELNLLKSHLAECNSCQSYVERSMAVKKSLTALPRYKTSSSFDIVLRERLRNEIKREKKFQLSSLFNFSFDIPFRIPSVVAGAVAVVVLGIFITQTLSVSKNKNQSAIADQEMNNSKTLIVPALQQSTHDQSLKMKNYVNVREQFQLDAQYPKSLETASNQPGRFERVPNKNDSIRIAKPNTLNKSLIRQANATVHF